MMDDRTSEDGQSDPRSPEERLVPHSVKIYPRANAGEKPRTNGRNKANGLGDGPEGIDSEGVDNPVGADGDPVNADASREPDEAWIARLAALPLLDYERVREAEAKAHRVRVGVLDSLAEAERAKARAAGSEKDEETDGSQGASLDFPPIEPWPNEVDGAELLEEIVAAIARHVILGSPHDRLAIALWTVFSHVFTVFRHAPRLFLTSPDKRCGKSTAMGVIKMLVPRPLLADNITTAALFRVIALKQPTLMIDEADSFVPGNEELRGILNSGHARDGCVIRLVGDEHEPRQFRTWGPLVLASIGRLPGTVEDRSIIVSMKRRMKSEPVDPIDDAAEVVFEELAQRVARWTADHRAALASGNPRIPAALSDRAADNWRPLMAVAECLGGDWPARATEAALHLSHVPDAFQNYGVLALEDIRALFDDPDRVKILSRTGEKALASAAIVDAFGEMETRPWPEYGRRPLPITAVQLARLLAPFGIIPGTIRVGSGKDTMKGYKQAAFKDAFARYLDPPTDPSPDSGDLL